MTGDGQQNAMETQSGALVARGDNAPSTADERESGDASNRERRVESIEIYDCARNDMQSGLW